MKPYWNRLLHLKTITNDSKGADVKLISTTDDRDTGGINNYEIPRLCGIKKNGNQELAKPQFTWNGKAIKQQSIKITFEKNAEMKVAAICSVTLITLVERGLCLLLNQKVETN